ncbi:transposase [Rickettsia endosymbiont of Oedothorax gibbosus]|nr:transposase [Rickettsia endosymbiont of Oedothorax gibbosus]
MNYISIYLNFCLDKGDHLSIWIGKNEGAKFWMQVVTELKNRGIEQIYVACVGFKGLSRSYKQCIPEYYSTIMYCTYGSQFSKVCVI